MLSEAEQQAYATQGYVVPSFRFPRAYIDELVTELDAMIARNPDVRPEKLVNAHLEGRTTGAVKGSARFLDLAMRRELVDMVAALIGEDVILWGCHIFCKPAGTGQETPWHQDGHYWPIRPLATCTAWVALEPSTRENGCLRVVPGSHRERRLFDHMREDRTDTVLAQQIDRSAFEESDAVDIELEPGQLSLHDVFMIHGANANRSPRRRTGVAIRYMPGTAHFDRSLGEAHGASGLATDYAHRPLWLLRGADRTGLNNFTIGHARASG